MTSTTTRRKGGGAPRSMEAALQMETLNHNEETNHHSPVNGLTGKPLSIAKTQTITASVKRHKYGTGPFDEQWLNLDCCGLFCALVTYGLHLYGVYAVCLILLPPWMSETDEEGIRTLTWGGHFHRCAFTAVAVLAMYAHFKAMTTDPGAVPPDAVPLPEKAQPFSVEDANNGANPY